MIPDRAHRPLHRLTAALLFLPLLLVGCRHPRKSTSAPNTTDYAPNLEAVVAQPQLAILRWPNYSDYQGYVHTFYDDRNFELAWIRDLKPTATASAFLQAFADAGAKGLRPEDYDASKWPARLAAIGQIQAASVQASGTPTGSTASQPAPANGPETVAQFDAAMTVCVMRYISDLRIGRVNPQHFNFDIDVASKKYDLAEFLSDHAVDETDVPKLIRSVEPDSDQYRATEAALVHYVALAQEQAAASAPMLPAASIPKSGLPPGEAYAAAGQLLARLQLEGDAPGDYPLHAAAAAGAPGTSPTPKHPRRDQAAKVLGKAEARAKADADRLLHRAGPTQTTTPAPAVSQPTAATPQPMVFDPPQIPPTYTADLAAAVKLYQHRHGLTEDGKLTAETVASLNVPLSERVLQLEDSLERWRWLPAQYLNSPLLVNLPEFVLRGYSPTHQLEFTMKVVVGKVIGEHYTPVFAHMMRYLIFRPYWNVPVDIARKEIAPHMGANPNYLAAKNFEATDSKGNPVSANAKQVAGGQVLVREKPGPKNSLGLVKFMFPNQYDIYLHSTPAPELFERTRRDFSHGCVRVQKPEDLAVWVLKNSGTPGDWDAEKVHNAMTAGSDNHQINLKTPIPIVIFYVTAIAAEDGHTHFFNDLYGYDQKLQQVLALGPPYPVKPDPTVPKPTPGDTL